MSSFLIFKQPESQMNWRFVTLEGNTLTGRFPRYSVTRPEFDMNMYGEGNEHRTDHIILQNVTTEQAQVVAQTMANKTPGVTWLVAELSSAFVAPAGPVTKLIYTDKGVLPA